MVKVAIWPRPHIYYGNWQIWSAEKKMSDTWLECRVSLICNSKKFPFEAVSVTIKSNKDSKSVNLYTFEKRCKMRISKKSSTDFS